MIRILLAEDQAMVRQGLKMMIEAEADMQVTGEAANGLQAITLCERQKFDVVLMDIRMPVMDGLQAARIALSRWPALKVLILTTFNDDEYALAALQGGASGYLLKDADAEELTRAIRSCLAGGLVLEDHVAANILPKLIRGKTEQAVDENLTGRELDIIRRIGEGRSNREIAAELALSVGTVKNHISVILDKLELRDRTQVAIYAIRSGIV
ncbi:response regulator transcription factor [Planomicrobium sp. YIM 101495]|uniref:response regulator transcription factor n=1 Tax=Planomicrobium sp. YIM 101495 TaxID=2665160 RepID=UPI0012B9F41E|nr:response regulator transcription factor [Planomicrobium sp. YIM 101495]MTD31290.1 response regulator [Planomicrobium sp. YIM 101495]